MKLLSGKQRKLQSPLGAPRITEQPRSQASSERYIHDPMTQGYRPGGWGVGHVARCQGSCFGAQDRSSLFLVIPFWRTIITLPHPPVTHGPRSSKVQVSAMQGTCIYVHSSW